MNAMIAETKKARKVGLLFQPAPPKATIAAQRQFIADIENWNQLELP